MDVTTEIFIEILAEIFTEILAKILAVWTLFYFGTSVYALHKSHHQYIE